MDLLITHKDLAQLLSDIQFIGGEHLKLRWVSSDESGEWFAVYLTRGQVKRLNNTIPKKTIEERYHSR